MLSSVPQKKVGKRSLITFFIFGHFVVTFSDASATFFITFLPDSCQTPFVKGELRYHYTQEDYRIRPVQFQFCNSFTEITEIQACEHARKSVSGLQPEIGEMAGEAKIQFSAIFFLFSGWRPETDFLRGGHI